MHRIYPQHVKRPMPMPDWTKIPFVSHGPPPAMFFTICGAKAIARHEWFRRFGNAEPSEEAIKKFVFGVHWRWRGDHANRYKVLASWAYEFAAETKRAMTRAEAKEMQDAAVDEPARPDIKATESEAYEVWWDSEPHIPQDPHVSLRLLSGRPAPGELKRSILLNPRQPKRRGNPRKR